MLERLEVVVVRDPGEAYDRDLDLPLRAPGRGRGVVERHGVFVGDAELADVGEHAEHRHAGPLLEEAEPRVEETRIAAELVDDEPRHARALVRLEELHRADERREDPAPIDVPDEDDRRVGDPGDEHVHDVAFLQVNLRGTAGPFDHDEVVRRPEPRERRADHVAELGLVRVVLDRPHPPDGLPEDDDLRARVPLRLEQDRVHVDRAGRRARPALAPPARARSRRRRGSRKR